MAGKILLTEREAADMIGFTPRYLQECRYRGKGPKYVQISRRAIRYRPADLEEWANSLLREPVASPAFQERRDR